MSNKSKIMKDLLKYIPQTVVPGIIAFISVPIYTHIFNPHAYGNLEIVKVSNNILDYLSTWIGSSLTRYFNVFEKERKLEVMITTVIKAIAISGLLLALPFLLALRLINVSSQLGLLFGIGITLFFLTLFKKTLMNVLRMRRQINVHSFFVILTSVFSFLSSLALIFYFGLQIESILLGNLIVVAILLPFVWRTSIRNSFSFRIHMDFHVIKQFALYGIPLTISRLGVWLLNLSDRYLIGALLTSYELGVYSSCYNVTWNSLFLIVNLFFMMEEPLAMKVLVHEGKKGLKDFVRHETRIFLIFFTPLLFFLCCYSDFIFSIMVSKEYQKGAVIVPYVAVSVLLSGLIFKYHLGIMASEKTRSLMFIVVASGLSNVLLNIVLIPRMGILGAGVSTLASYALYLAAVVVFSKKVFPWAFPFGSLVRIGMSAAVAIYPLSIMSWTRISIYGTAFLAACSLLVYFLLLVALKEFDRDEISSFRLHLKNLTWGHIKKYAKRTRSEI